MTINAHEHNHRKCAIPRSHHTIKKLTMRNASWEESKKDRHGKHSAGVLQILNDQRRPPSPTRRCNLQEEVAPLSKEGKTLRFAVEVKYLLKLLRSNDFIGTVDPELHAQYLTVLEEVRCKQSQVLSKQEPSAGPSETHHANLTLLDKELQDVRTRLESTKLVTEEHSQSGERPI
jgi:hypothetical protein